MFKSKEFLCFYLNDNQSPGNQYSAVINRSVINHPVIKRYLKWWSTVRWSIVPSDQSSGVKSWWISRWSNVRWSNVRVPL